MLATTQWAFRETVTEHITRAHREGLRRYKTHRRITPSQEMAYRLCHQDHLGMSQICAAEVMKISPSRVNRLLDRVKQVAPQLFPILAPRIAKMYELFMENYTCREIAETLGVTPRAVQYAIKELFRTRREVGLYFRSNSERRLSYRTYMDEWIKEKF